MNLAVLIGRIIFAAFWLMSSSNHFAKLNHMSGYAKAKGVPFPQRAAAGTGASLLLGGAAAAAGHHATKRKQQPRVAVPSHR